MEQRKVTCILKSTCKPKTFTDAGTMIAKKPVQKNATFSICDKIDSDSNVTEERKLHSEKQFASKNTTESGMTRNARFI
jgi:hypothetical protein